MILRKVYSETGLLINDVIFSLGINIILGKYSSDPKSRGVNGIGKSTLIRLIDYCLLSDNAQKIFKKNEYDFLRKEDHNIILEFEIENKLFFIRRWFKEEKKASFGASMNTMEEYDTVDLKRILGNKLFPIQNENIVLNGNRYRTIMNFFIKDDLDHQQRKDPLNFLSYNPNAIDKAIYNFFLMGLPTTHLLEFSDIVKIYRTKNQILKALREKVQEDTGKSIEEFKSEKVKIEKNIQVLQNSLKDYVFLENYKNIEQSLVEITGEINIKLEAFHSLEQKINKIRSAFGITPNINKDEIQRLYNEVLDNFGSLVKKSLDEVTDFKNQILENRRKFLFRQEKKLEEQSKGILRDISRLEKDRSKLYQILKEKGALDSIENTYEQIIEEKSILERTLQTLTRFEDVQSDIYDLQTDLLEKQKDIRGDLKDNTNQVEHLRELFQDILSNAIFMDEDFEKAYFDISLNEKAARNHLPFKINIEIPKADALGQFRLKIIAYDLMIFLNSIIDQRDFPRFLAHDGVFHAISPSTLINTLNYIHTQFLDYPNFQYILTFNQDEIPSELESSYGKFSFDWTRNVILEIEETDKKMLFKRAF